MSDCLTDDWMLSVTPVVRLERPKKTFVHSVFERLTSH